MKPKSRYELNEEIKQKFARAKAFITVEQYDKAREILKTIDHPTATKWLEKLDIIAPETTDTTYLDKLPPAEPDKRQARRNLGMGCLMFALICGALYITTPRSAPVAATPTVVAAAATSTPPAAEAVDVVAPESAETATPSATITDTSTPTITETVIPSPTITDTPVASPTDDTAARMATVDALATAGEAVIAPIRKPLEQFGDFQGLRNLSAMMLSDGISVSIDANVAPADDNDVTMWRVLALVQGLGRPISQIRVTTFSREQIDSLWLWEDGVWSVTRLATGITEEFSSPPAWMATPVTGQTCPSNCAEAVALGWTAQQAGQCSNLDRDGDGVACYND